MTSEIKVKIDGDTFAGWETLGVSRALGSLSGDFNFNLIDFPIDKTKNFAPGKSVEVEMSGGLLTHRLITGYIDRVVRTKEGRSTSLEFAGRDKTSDLIDSSAIYKNNYWKKKKISKIIKDICDPFDISVVLDVDDVNVDDFTIQSGETAFTAIERLARAYSFLLMTDENGRLLLSKVSSDRASVRLEVGQNVKRIMYEEDNSGRYSEYLAKGQGKGGGSEWSNDIVSLKGECSDSGIDRYRPYVFSVEKKMNRTEIQKRVNWEAQVRAGRAIRCEVVVNGWLQDPTSEVSEPWKINLLTNVVDKTWGIDSELVTSSVNFSLTSSGGRLTTLELSPPEIFSENPGDTVKLSNRSSVRAARITPTQGPVPITY